MPEPRAPRRRRFYLYATGIVALSLFELYALARWGTGTGLEKASALAALLGFYGIGLGLFSGSGGLAEFREIAAGLTDPNPLLYFSSNMYFCGLLMMFGSLGLNSRMQPDTPRGLSLIGMFAWLPVGLLLIAYALFHAAVVTFLAYIPLVIASAIIVRITYSANDVGVAFGEERASLKEVVRANETALKGYVMGVPALALSLFGTLASLGS